MNMFVSRLKQNYVSSKKGTTFPIWVGIWKSVFLASLQWWLFHHIGHRDHLERAKQYHLIKKISMKGVLLMQVKHLKAMPSKEQNIRSAGGVQRWTVPDIWESGVSVGGSRPQVPSANHLPPKISGGWVCYSHFHTNKCHHLSTWERT